ncbi:hypothetical protein [Desulfuromonas acetoxidans]|uniref:DUF8082 domain-containing protein n=1 Tax=Desulfuromonas acetoxidans (strain DSM 684 / 11070) TaxID=281689 RepID=Q1JX66_DESA6|nr:hypothetical protein [Desulfuromonas acetoxidans]EAT14796.1 hypothetical protein Dace_0935 [Desulfuromonas acetoxidans DSM 684]MBF0645289.1 hypothetical protein [Desulfuromonas acetoxidans]NVD25595.1 hypothetical protein [Desulfuromonas acetoxidans]NVE17595.1 hypothetical protein [Desulfuromonas acetoxidans]
MEQMVAALKEIPGVLGICLYDSAQQITLNRMPSFFSASAWEDLGPVVAELYSQATDKLTTTTSLTLHFDTVSLVITTWQDNTAVILGESQMNEHMIAYSLGMLQQSALSSEPASLTSSQPELFFKKKIPELRQGLIKIAGPMAEIIFDDALDQWENQVDFSFDAFLCCLRDELEEQQQFDEYLSICADTVSEIKNMEGSRG